MSLWRVVKAAEDEIDSYDPAEFSGARWLTRGQVMDTPVSLLDPHMHRFLESGALG